MATNEKRAAIAHTHTPLHAQVARWLFENRDYLGPQRDQTLAAFVRPEQPLQAEQQFQAEQPYQAEQRFQAEPPSRSEQPFRPKAPALPEQPFQTAQPFRPKPRWAPSGQPARASPP